MRKILKNLKAARLVAGVTAVLALSGVTVLASETGGIRVTIDGAYVNFDVTHPQIISDRVMVPMRDIFEALGAEIRWDEAAQAVTAQTEGGDIILLTIGRDIIYINDRPETMDTVPQIVDGRTLVPVRFVAQATGMGVRWDEASRTVVVTSEAGPPAAAEPYETATAPTWREAYAEILHILRDDLLFEGQEWYSGNYFALHDIDGSGAPELITGIATEESELIFNIYTFRDNRLIELEHPGGTRVVVPSDNSAEIIIVTRGGGTGRAELNYHERFRIDGGRLVSTGVAARRVMDWDNFDERWEWLADNAPATADEIRSLFVGEGLDIMNPTQANIQRVVLEQ